MSKSINFEIIAGTYEEYLLGYLFSSEENSLVQSFASHDHSSSLRCLATCGNYLASGAADDRIIIYDLKTRKEQCMLTQHESTITSLSFTNNHSHVISASKDGVLALVRVGNWQLEKVWDKAHMGSAILDIAIHSSGKLALTLGTDGTIRTWNLIKGRPAYIINLFTKCKDPKSLERLIFAPDSVRFVLYGGKFTEIWSIEAGGALKVIQHEQKVTCSTWLDNDTLFVGYEDGNIAIIDVESEKKKEKSGHNGRVKAVECIEGYIVTASSTGNIKVWTRKLREVASVDTGCRITCICTAQWAGKVEKEEKDEDSVKQVVEKERKPGKSVVTVEIEGSDDEGEGDRLRKEKRNKKNQVKEVGEELVGKKLMKRKKIGGEEGQEESFEAGEKVVRKKSKSFGKGKIKKKRKVKL